ncbi:MAG TPA: vWA domain-containing protein, partial [Planctomycetaceae bacterium]|nr:vWA domain-containing protein [Planctomycetaceae bacterium]
SMNFTSLIGRLLGYEDVTQIEGWRPSFGASWAHSSPLLLVCGLLAAAGLSAWFYLRMQPRGRTSLRIALSILRAVALGALLLILADPILEITLIRHPQPTLWVALDGSESMAIADELPAEQRQDIEKATHWSTTSGDDGTATKQPTRSDYIRSFLSSSESTWLKKLEDRFRVKTFVVSDERGVQALDTETAQTAAQRLDAWSPRGTVTALGDSLEELARRQAGDNLAGVILFSDFDQNAGGPPISAARRLGAPLFTVGVGPESAVDLAVDLSAPPTMKKAEGSTLVATVRQRELENTPVTVRVFALAPAQPGSTDRPQQLIGERSLTLTASAQTVEFPYSPEQTGRFTFVAEIDPIAGETITQNNRAERDVRIIDDFLRLLYVEYEPTWEWRFVKEVFHRDKLVGLRGFRTFLRSADPVVRETNELFVSSLTLPRSEFFEADVIFLGDLPASALSTRFCEMTKEFVEQFGGGLVVLGGPRFGPGQLAETPLADLLPVVVDRDGRRRDDRDFRLQLTPLAGQYDFMRLGRTETESSRAWNALGKLPWYQPVLRVDPRATVVAEHP